MKEAVHRHCGYEGFPGMGVGVVEIGDRSIEDYWR